MKRGGVIIRVLRLAVLGFLLGGLLYSAKRTLELRGRIAPPLRNVWVGIQGATTPFRAQTLSDSRGRFRFKNLRQGAYTLVVFHPHSGEQRHTVEMTSSFADENGRVETSFEVGDAGGAHNRGLTARHTVSVRELSISGEARSAFRKANKKLARHDIDGAVVHLEKAAEISPQFLSVWNQLGTIAYQRSEYQRAERMFRRALELRADSHAPVVNLGAALLALGRPKEALPFNRYAATLRDDDALSNAQLGRNYFVLGDSEAAILYLNKAKQLDGSHFSLPQITLAEIYRRQGRIRKAIVELEDFLKRHPDSERAASTRQVIERLRTGQIRLSGQSAAPRQPKGPE